MPQTGSDGSGYALAASAGLSVHTPSPALTPLLCEGKFLSSLAGVRCHARVTLLRGREVPVASECGELQWTKYGISGIAVFQLSRHVSCASKSERFAAEIDLLDPYLDDEVLSSAAHKSTGAADRKRSAACAARYYFQKN